MKVLIIGDGAREQALARKLAKSKKISEVLLCPGNAGTKYLEKCRNLPAMTKEALLSYAKVQGVGYTVVGPEKDLMEGIVDLFQEAGEAIIGPHKAAALLEGSKGFAKKFMEKYHVKTPGYAVFDHYDKAAAYLAAQSFPVVIKADGLAQGKGVEIVTTLAEGLMVLQEYLLAGKFQGAGKTVVIEEFLVGKEASILALYDGETILPLWSTMDHKKIGEGETGLNTGGMGSISPNLHFTKTHEEVFKHHILENTLLGLQQEGLSFQGILFFGLMLTNEEVYLLEYNLRFGDPETQSLLEVLETDLYELFWALLNKDLKDQSLTFQEEGACVVLSAKGYPKKKGDAINITDFFNKCPEDLHLHSYACREEEGEIYSSSGRVLSISTKGPLENSLKKIYTFIDEIDNENLYFRRDIGRM